MKRMTATIAALLFVAVAVAADVTCPIDDFAMYFTGKTKVVSGKMLLQYRCPSGHITWVVQ